MTPEQKFELITRNLQEVLSPQIINDVLNEGRPLKIYWGTAPTGRPHIAYFVAMTKIADFLAAGCEVTILLADLHAFLDNMKAPLEVVEYRVEYYRRVVQTILTSIGVSIDRLKFVVGKEYQLSAEYTLDLFRLSNVVSQNDAKRAGADVVKQVANPLLSGLIYPLMQALDEEYLKVDCQFGGVDQRKIFVLATEQLGSIGYKKRAHLMNKMVPGLTQGGKMSASDPNSKIDLLDDEATVQKKIKKAHAAPGEVEGNGLIAFLEHVVFPIARIRGDEAGLLINRPDKYGGPLTYKTIEELKADYAADKLAPGDLKIGATDAINELLEPLRKEFSNSEEFRKIEAQAYPVVQEAPKKVKVKKDKGSRYPGGAPGAAAGAEGAKDGAKDGSDGPAKSKDSIEEVSKKLAESKVE